MFDIVHVITIPAAKESPRHPDILTVEASTDYVSIDQLLNFLDRRDIARS